jgi:hypothetical protein
LCTGEIKDYFKETQSPSNEEVKVEESEEQIKEKAKEDNNTRMKEETLDRVTDKERETDAQSHKPFRRRVIVPSSLKMSKE